MQTNIQTYNNMIYESRPVKYIEFVSDKYNKIHEELYLNALTSAINEYLLSGANAHISDINDFYNQINIIEIKNSEYWQPSDVIWRYNSYPFAIISSTNGEFPKKDDSNQTYSRGQMSLAKWWNMYQKFDHKKITNTKFGINQVNDFAIISLNYVSGIAILESKTTHKQIEVPFEYLDKNTPIDDEMLLSNTFTSLYNN